MNREVEPIRVGIVGLAASGWDIHARALGSMPERYRVVAVADRMVDRAESCASELGVCAYASCEALLADLTVELVVVATCNLDHADQAEAALRAGKHVVARSPSG